MEYIIVRRETPLELERKVQEQIEKGFKPHGSLVVVPTFNRTFYYLQAMVKELVG